MAYAALSAQGLQAGPKHAGRRPNRKIRKNLPSFAPPGKRVFPGQYKPFAAPWCQALVAMQSLLAAKFNCEHGGALFPTLPYS
jgi:hypothetical protein